MSSVSRNPFSRPFPIAIVVVAAIVFVLVPSQQVLDLINYTVGITAAVLVGWMIAIRRVLKQPSRYRRMLAFTISLGFTVNLVALIFFPEMMRVKFGQPYTFFGDPIAYHATATELMDRPVSTWLFERDNVYYQLVALLYKAYGSHRFVPRLFNLALIPLLVAYVYDVAKSAFDDEIASITVLFTVLTPSLIALTASIMHDMFAITLTMGLFAYLFDIREQLDKYTLDARSVAGLITVVFLLYWLRTGILWIILGALSLWVGVLVWNQYRASIRPRHYILLIVVLVIVAVETYPILSEYIQSFNRVAMAMSRKDDAGFAKRIASAPIYLRIPFGSIAFALMPFPPWELIIANRAAAPRLYAATAFVLYFVYPLCLFGVIQSVVERETRQWFLALYVLIFGAGIAAMVGGLTPRWRTQIVIVIWMFASVGIRQLRAYKRLIPIYVLAMVAGISIFYLLSSSLL